MKFFLELYKLLFITSFIFVSYVVGDFTMKVYLRFKLQQEPRFFLTREEKILLWISLALIFNYIT